MSVSQHKMRSLKQGQVSIGTNIMIFLTHLAICFFLVQQLFGFC